ncbi:hypothetical protein CYMTET_2719 [Cymbomonas tetramitiformis]|uniref:Uncharacterized protein n=1 Tax=Cymbomonas tetramitiformis TaxID=36881 RepID=A0AAE0H543_9CHLO|nr:hypothetical protein CYMTET_2719 [Cymbomonas tetramitiformis]
MPRFLQDIDPRFRVAKTHAVGSTFDVARLESVVQACLGEIKKGGIILSVGRSSFCGCASSRKTTTTTMFIVNQGDESSTVQTECLNWLKKTTDAHAIGKACRGSFFPVKTKRLRVISKTKHTWCSRYARDLYVLKWVPSSQEDANAA